MKRSDSTTLLQDIPAALTAMLVALPSAVAYALIAWAPLGSQASGSAALAGIIGTFALGLLAALFGGTPRLISAPCAPAAAVLAVFSATLVDAGITNLASIALMFSLAAALTGIVQIVIGLCGGGKLIKYIPYPVVAGYLSGVGLIILVGQLPKLLGSPKDLGLFQALTQPATWQWTGIITGLATIATMLLSTRFLKKIPAAIVALAVGTGSYFLQAMGKPELLSLDHNKLVIGLVQTRGDFFQSLASTWSTMPTLGLAELSLLVVPVFTLAALLSIDTLKTCVVLDVITRQRHNSNRELIGQGLGNLLSGLLGGMPGAGTMGATMVNINSGAKSSLSGVLSALLALAVALFLLPVIAWIPVASLAGILIVVAVRMIDLHSLKLLRHRSTILDFLVIVAVIATAIGFGLVQASAVGIGFAIVLFLRDQMRGTVVRRSIPGNRIFSRTTRSSAELAVLEQAGETTMVFELQGQLFFGTADQLYTQVEPWFKRSRYIIFSMKNVQSIDYTAVNMLRQILRAFGDCSGTVILAALPRSLATGRDARQYLAELGLDENTQRLRLHPDLDSALEWTESMILAQAALGQRGEEDLTLDQFELFAGAAAASAPIFAPILEERSVKAGETVFRKGDSGRELYLLRRGEVQILLPMPDGSDFHLASFAQGSFFGDMAFLDGEPRSADAQARSNCRLYVLHRERFDELATRHPDAAAAFFATLSTVVSRRLRQSHKALMALQDS